MRGTVIALAVLAGCAAPQTAEAPTLPVNPVEMAIARTVYLEGSGCTAVAMGADRMVTAKHCAPDGAAAGDTYEGGILLFVSPTEDFVVIEVFDARHPVALHAGKAGEHIYVVGYPVQLGNGEQDLTVTDGIIAGPISRDLQHRITAPVYFGNSGGGVWSDRGELVGIAVSIFAAHIDNGRPIPYAGQSFMVPVSSIRPYL